MLEVGAGRGEGGCLTTFSSLGRSTGRAIALPPASALASGLAKC